VASVTPLRPRHRVKIKKPSAMSNSNARKRRAEACREKLMATGTCAKNYMPQGAKGELDLVGYDGETIAFVEIRTHRPRS
jgi:hypothetical protein